MPVTMSKDALEGSGVNHGWKTRSVDQLSQWNWIPPEDTLYIWQIISVRRRTPKIPASSHRYESPGYNGPGTILTAQICTSWRGSKSVKTDVPMPSLRDPLLTAVHVVVVME